MKSRRNNIAIYIVSDNPKVLLVDVLHGALPALMMRSCGERTFREQCWWQNDWRPQQHLLYNLRRPPPHSVEAM